MSLNLVDTEGRSLTPLPPPGFYVSGECPHCSSPILYHGGGRVVVKGDAFMPQQIVDVPPQFYPSCLCEWKAEEMSAPRVPDHYNLIEERQAVDGVMYGILTLMQQCASLQARVNHFTEQIGLVDDQDSGGGESELEQPLTV